MKIIYYMPMFLKSQAKTQSNKKLVDFCEIFKIVSPNACIIDRTNSFNTPFDIKVLNEIPSRPSTIEYTYDDICINRAKSILKENKNIVVFYSGGLDSTVVLLSFIQAIKSGTGNYNQITVSATPYSIIENPIFWEKYIVPNFNLVSANRTLEQVNDPSTITDRYVMGENADQMFGSDIILNNFDLFNQEISELNISKFVSAKNVNADSHSYIVDSLITVGKNCPTDLNNMADLIWWLNFSSKWQSVSLRTLCFTNFLDNLQYEEQLKMFDTFFNTPEFQILSLYGNIKKWGDTPSPYNYKLQARLFIEKYCDIGNYTKIKAKIPSLYRVLTATGYKYAALGTKNGKIYQIDNIKIND